MGGMDVLLGQLIQCLSLYESEEGSIVEMLICILESMISETSSLQKGQLNFQMQIDVAHVQKLLDKLGNYAERMIEAKENMKSIYIYININM